MLLANCTDKLALTDLGTLPPRIAGFLLNRDGVCMSVFGRELEKVKRVRDDQHSEVLRLLGMNPGCPSWFDPI